MVQLNLIIALSDDILLIQYSIYLNKIVPCTYFCLFTVDMYVVN